MKKVFKSLFLGLVTVGMFFTGCKLEEESNNLALIAAAAADRGSGKTITGIQLCEDGKLDPEATSKDDAQKLYVGKSYNVEVVYTYSDGSVDEDPIDFDDLDDDDYEIKSNDTDYIAVKGSKLVVKQVTDADDPIKVTIRVTKDGKDYKAKYWFKAVEAPSKTLESITVVKTAYTLTEDSAESDRTYTVTANYSDKTTGDVTAVAEAKSSKDSVVTANAGLITVHGLGSATITITYEENGEKEQAEISVSVVDPDDSIVSVAITSATTLAYGNELTLESKGTHESGTESILALSDVKYSIVSGSDYATLANGVLTNKNKSGSEQSVVVKVEYEDLSATATIKLAAYVDEPEIDVSKSSFTLTSKGGTATFKVTYKASSSADEEDVTSKATIKSSNTNVATVSGGTITAVANGTAVITVTYNGCEATINVTVNIPTDEDGSATIGFDFN